MGGQRGDIEVDLFPYRLGHNHVRAAKGWDVRDLKNQAVVLGCGQRSATVEVFGAIGVGHDRLDHGDGMTAISRGGVDLQPWRIGIQRR